MAPQSRTGDPTIDLVAALGALPDPVCRIDREGRMVAANAAFRALFGDSARAAAAFDACRPALAEALRGDRTALESDIAVGHGRSLRVAWSALPGADGLLLIGRDVTAQHHTAEALAASNRRLRALMDALPVGVSISDDPTCTRVTGNAALLAQFAARPEDNLSASANDHTEHGRQIRFSQGGVPLDPSQLPLQRAVAGNTVVPPMEIDVELPDGRRWVCEASGAPIRDDAGAVVGGVAVTVDISARRRAREAREHRAQHLARLAQTAPGVLHSFRRAPDGRVRFPYGGERVAELYGIEGCDLALDATPVFGAIHPDDVPHVQATVEESARNMRPWQTEYRVRHPQRGDVWIEGHSAPLADEDGGITWHGYLTDVSARKRDEIRLRRVLLQLAARNRELQDFAFIASHDLQEPLRKISAFCDKLMVRHGAALDPAARDYLQRSIDAAGRMQSLIADLLAFSRVLSRGKPFAPVALGEVLAEACEDLALRVEESRATIEAGTLPVLSADRGQMRQLMQNLVGNALKFSAPERRPVLRIDAEAIRLDGDRPGFRLRFADNGIGFEAQFAERIFVPFERLHEREAYPGTGIGLAIVRRIVERHQGRITAVGRPGEGATFVVDLPAEPQSETPWALPGEPVLGEAVGS